MSANKKPIGSDLQKVDAHKIAPHEYDDAPKIDADWFDQADAHEGPILKRRGRPKSERPKELTTLRLSPDVLDHFRSGGAGWQTRLNAALEEWIKQKT